MSLTAQAQVVRMKRLTGTRIAKVLGLSKYGGPMSVYLELVEGVREEVDEESPDILRGQFLEPSVLEWYRHEMKLVAHKATPRVHPVHGDIFSATPDFFAGPSANDWDRVGEIKCPRYGDDWGPSGTDQVAEYHIPQLVLEMACSDMPQVDVAALIYGQLRVYNIKRDLELEATIIDAGLRFWRDHIEKKCPPPVDGSPVYSDFLARRFPNAGKVMLASTPEADALAAQLASAKRCLEEAEQQEKVIKQQLQQLIGDAAGIQGDWGKVAWGNVKGRASTDWPGLVAAAGISAEMVSKFTKNGDGYRAFRATFKKGA